MTVLGFLAGYRGFTRDAYALDLRQFTTRCWQRDHQLFNVRRVDIESFARDLEDRGRARATVARRLCTIVGFYRDAEKKESASTPRPCTSAARESTTAPTSPTSTATSSAPTSKLSARTGDTHPDGVAQRRQARHHAARPACRPSGRSGR
jgi:hypothetical protein